MAQHCQVLSIEGLTVLREEPCKVAFGFPIEYGWSLATDIGEMKTNHN
jgi:hypothetical protein